MDENTGLVKIEQPQAPAHDSSAQNPAITGALAPEAGSTTLPSLQNQEAAVNVLNPRGELVSIPKSFEAEAFANGYTPASEDVVHKYATNQTYGGGIQQVVAGLEGAAQGVLGPLAPLIETKTLGVKEEDIRGRAEANPVTHYGSEIAGLGASMFTGTGLGSIASKAGGLAAAATGLGKASTAAKIGSAAAAAAIENMVIAGSDEVSKVILKDPETSVQNALVDVGLAGLLGGALGGGASGAHALWKGTAGKEAGVMLEALANKAGGIESEAAMSPIEKAIKDSGLEIAPELKAAVVQDPVIQQHFSSLMESASKSGLKTQAALKQFKMEASEAITNALGKTPDQVANLTELSAADAGETIKQSLSKSLEETLEPISASFENIKTKYSKELLNDAQKADISSRIGELVAHEGYGLSPSSPQYKVIQNTLDELGNLKSLEDMRKYQSILGDKTYGNPDLRRIGSQLKGILREAEENTVLEAAGRIAPEAIQEHALARDAYKNAMNTVEELNDRLHVGKFNGPKGFIKALKEMSPEDIVARLNPKNDAALITKLQEMFPSVADSVKDFYLSKALKVASKSTSPGEVINTKRLFSVLDDMSPEMRNFLIPEEAAAKIKAISAIEDAIPKRMNPSGTAKAVDSMLSNLPGAALGIASLLMGHSPMTAAVAGYLTKIIGREAPDAARLALLKFLGTDKPVSPGAFKNMVEFMQASIRGENLLSKGTKNVFKSGREILPTSLHPTEADRTKLNKMLINYQTNQTKAMELPGEAGHYMPDHAAAIAGVGISAVAYLNSLRPETVKQFPLSSQTKPNAVDQAKYNNALNIAQQPLIVLHKIQKGTITPQDVQTLQNVYPKLYERMSTKLTNEIAETVNKGETVPYKTRLGLSMFLGMPLDGTMSSTAIMGAQPKAPQGPAQGSTPRSPAGSKALQKTAQPFMTPSQAKELHRQQK